MAAYYNEIEPYAAEWLRNLIKARQIADGEVDTRSIVDVRPDDLRGFTQCHFFAGIGIWSHALRLAGWSDEREVWTGSCPCQPFSDVGKGEGFKDERHLWPVFHNLITECHPRAVFGEQVASKDGLTWLDLVHTDMEEAGYAIAAFDLCAAGVGAPHIRQRLYFVGSRLGHTLCAGLEGHTWHVDERSEPGRNLSPEDRSVTPPGRTNGYWRDAEWLPFRDSKIRPVEPDSFPLADGDRSTVGRLRAYGNAIVAPLAAEFIKAYMEIENGN